MPTAYFGRVKLSVLLGQRQIVARQQRAAVWAAPALRLVFRGRWRGWNTHPSSWTQSWVSGFPLDWDQGKFHPPPKTCLHLQGSRSQVAGSLSVGWSRGIRVCLMHCPKMDPGMAMLNLVFHQPACLKEGKRGYLTAQQQVELVKLWDCWCLPLCMFFWWLKQDS